MRCYLELLKLLNPKFVGAVVLVMVRGEHVAGECRAEEYTSVSTAVANALANVTTLKYVTVSVESPA